MRTADLPVGAHVAFNSYKSNSSSNYVEAFVIALRPKGNKSSYWGGRTGNGDTIGIAYTESYWKDAEGRPGWRFQWVRPADIHMTWERNLGLVAKYKADSDRQMLARKKAKADRTSRWDAIPASVREHFGSYAVERLIESGSTTIVISLEMIEAIVAAAQADLPDIKAAKVAAEVDSALRLLAG